MANIIELTLADVACVSGGKKRRKNKQTLGFQPQYRSSPVVKSLWVPAIFIGLAVCFGVVDAAVEYRGVEKLSKNLKRVRFIKTLLHNGIMTLSSLAFSIFGLQALGLV